MLAVRLPVPKAGGMSLSRLRSGGNPRPVPTGPALRPVNEHGVSASSRHRLCGETRAGWSVSSQPPEGDWREGHRGGGLRAETPGRAHSSGLYMGPTWSLWEAKCPRVIPSAPGPPIRAWNLVGWGVRSPQQGWRVIRAYWRGRSRLTGEPLGVKAGRVGGTPDDGRSVGRRNRVVMSSCRL
jgi:hypothetical protein